MSDHAEDSSAAEKGPLPRVSDFDLIRRIGEGGFGQVWLAANRATGQLRAAKVIPLDRPGSTDPAGREITSITRLEKNVRRQHPNLMQIHHVGKSAEHLFYIMDLADDVSGGPGSSAAGYRPATLQSRLADGPLPPEECFRYARQLLCGLAFLHESGMVHRDVKPANCLFVEGELKLADFGLLTEADLQASRVGTVKYMPPDGRMDAQADVYAAGLVIYEMITGLPADRFPDPGQRAVEAVENPILGLLTRLALRACQPDARQRFRDARHMLAELEASQSDTEARWTRLRRQVVSVAAGVLIALGLGAAIWWAMPSRRVHVNFVTHPFEARIYLDEELQKDDGNVYRTPCTIRDLPARVHHVVFEHDELGRLEAGPRDFAKQRRIEVRWDSEP